MHESFSIFDSCYRLGDNLTFNTVCGNPLKNYISKCTTYKVFNSTTSTNLFLFFIFFEF